MKIGLIGGGNMARAMIMGILNSGISDSRDILVSDINEDILCNLKNELGINTTNCNQELVKACDIIVLAVKPQVLEAVLVKIKDYIDENKLLISIAPSKSILWICDKIQKVIGIVRAMPNMPAQVGAGCSVICRNRLVSDEYMGIVNGIFGSFGLVEEVPESLFSVVTGISGSSPAYVYIFIEAMADAAVLKGMSREMAYRLAAGAVLGSAKMVLDTGEHPAKLKDMVCSPGGTTIEAVKILERDGMRGTIIAAVEACVDKADKL